MSNTNQIKEVIIHAGYPKTGTSSIQKTLYNKENNAILKEAGIFYPRCWGRNHGPALKGAITEEPEKYFSARWHQIVTKEQIEEYNQLNLEKLKTAIQDQLQNNETDKLLFSGEQLSKLSTKALTTLKKYLQIIGLDSANFTILLYTRDPISWTNSMAQQILKQGGAHYGSVIEKQIPTLFQRRIGNFVDVFGRKSVHVYSFEQAREHEVGLVGHILEKSGIDIETINKMKQIRFNESISMFSGEVLAYVQKTVPKRIKGKPNPKREKNDYQPFQEIHGDKFALSYDEKLRVQSNAKEDILWLKENYQIDYTQTEIKEDKKYKHIEKTLEDVEIISPQLTGVLRLALIEFMENHFIEEIPIEYKKRCQQVIQNLKGQAFPLMQQEITKLRKEVKEHKKAKKATQMKLKNLLNSKSWKVTFPLRKTVEMISGKK